MGSLSNYISKKIKEKERDEKDEWLLHLDVFDTTSGNLDTYLFELILFGGIYNPSTGFCLTYHPHLFHFRVELATGPLHRRLSVPFFGVVNLLTPNRYNFEGTRRGLKRGMGKLRFYGRRYDGTSMRKEQNGIRPANAYERLQYVAHALNYLSNEGKFPRVFQPDVVEKEEGLPCLRQSYWMSMSMGSSTLLSRSEDGIGGGEGDLNGSACFDLVLKYSRMKRGKISLWCVWNYINLVYCQLRELNFPEGPIDRLFEEQKEGLESLNEEVVIGVLVEVLLKSAREIATRQNRSLQQISEVLFCEFFSSLVSSIYFSIWDLSFHFFFNLERKRNVLLRLPTR